MSQYAGTPIIRRTARARRAAMMRNVTLSERARRLARTMWKHRWYYLLLIPPLAYYVIFRYIPIYNAQIAFKDFRVLLGVEGSPWTGLDNLQTFFHSYYFGQLMTNTIVLSVLKLVCGMPLAIILAIAIHESSFLRFRFSSANYGLPSAFSIMGYYVWYSFGNAFTQQWHGQ